MCRQQEVHKVRDLLTFIAHCSVYLLRDLGAAAWRRFPVFSAPVALDLSPSVRVCVTYMTDGTGVVPALSADNWFNLVQDSTAQFIAT